MPNTKKAIARQGIRTKLDGTLVEAGKEFVDYAERVDNLIHMGAASAAPDDEPVTAPIVAEPPAPTAADIDAIVASPDGPSVPPSQRPPSRRT